MFDRARLMTHRGAKLVTREQLAEYEPPPATPTWKPIRHAHIVDLIHEEMERRQIAVAKEEYAVQREGNFLFAVMVLAWQETEQFAAAVAFRHSNDKSEAMIMHAGANVWACDNMMLSGDEIILHRKHSVRLNIAGEMTKAFDRYQRGALILQRNIGELQGRALQPAVAEQKLFQIFYAKTLPSRLFVPVARRYFNEEPQTEYGMLNACTLFTKELQPGPNFRATVKLGKYFGLGVNGNTPVGVC